jgi:hypothetical protein
VVRCGDVLVLFDSTAAHQVKDRMFVCVDPVEGWFARIVTREPRHYPVKITVADHPFLDHDSYIETGIPAQYQDDEIEEAEQAGIRGRISEATAKRMLTAWEEAEVTPPLIRDAVLRHLRETYRL